MNHSIDQLMGCVPYEYDILSNITEIYDNDALNFPTNTIRWGGSYAVSREIIPITVCLSVPATALIPTADFRQVNIQ